MQKNNVCTHGVFFDDGTDTYGYSVYGPIIQIGQKSDLGYWMKYFYWGTYPDIRLIFNSILVF